MDDPEKIVGETRIYESDVRAHIAALYNAHNKVAAVEFRFASRILPPEVLDDAESA